MPKPANKLFKTWARKGSVYSLEQGRELLGLVRHAAEAVLKRQRLVLEDYKKYATPHGVYVCVNRGQLHLGCGGQVEARALYSAVVAATRRVLEALRPAPHPGELPALAFELHILGKPSLIRVRNADDYLRVIRLGREGLMIREWLHFGIVLANTPIEHGWDIERTLRQLCISAGLTMDAWRDLHHKIWRFDAQIFAEKDSKVVELRTEVWRRLD